MTNLLEKLSGYAAYHRDRRNIATHFVGIPMIVVSVFALLSRPALEVAGFTVSLAWVGALAAGLFYLRLDRRFGLAMLAVLLLTLGIGARLAALPTAWWLGASVALFVVGWVFQLVGHGFEGRKPAFVDDLVGLLIGPLFVLAEAAFALGLRTEEAEAITRIAGPTRSGAAGKALPAQE